MEETLDIQKIEAVKNPVKLFSADDALDSVLGKIEVIAKKKVTDFDVNTTKSRKAIASVAAKVARSKTFLDGLGKNLVADLKKQTGVIDAQRRQLRNRLDILKQEVRKPLTEWEQAEKDRVMAIQERIDALMEPATGSVVEIEAHIAEIEATKIDDSFAEFAEKAALAKDAALKRGKDTLESAKAVEEIKQKKKAAEDAARIEREKKIAEKAAAEARQIAEKQLENERKARINAENRAKLAEAEKKQQIQELINDEIHETVNANANREQKAEVNRTIVNALVEKAGLSDAQAKTVVIMIVKGLIPNIKITY